MTELHKTTRSRSRVTIRFNSENSTERILDSIEFSHTGIYVPNDSIVQVDIHEIVQTTAKPKYLHEIEVMKRAARAASEV